MTTKGTTTSTVRVEAENVGGIDQTSVSLRSGVTALTGRNATNRTSFMQAVMAALGSDAASVKGDADRGRAELEFDGETFAVDLLRRNGTVVLDGEPYLDDPAYADRFAFLLEDNPARRAVAQGGDLREVVMGPVDTDAIQAEIDDLEAEKRRLDDELDRLDSLSSRRADLERREAELEAKLETKREEREAAVEELEAADADVEESRDHKAELESVLEELQSVRSELDDVRYRLDSERESLDALEDEREEVEAELDDLPESPAGELSHVESEMERVRDRKRSVEATINQLDNVVQFNRETLSGDGDPFGAAADEFDDVGAAGDGDGDGGSVTDRLVEPASTRCWTCGSEVEETAIEETLDRLSDLRSRHVEERGEYSEELRRLKERRNELRSKQGRREELERTIDRVENEIERREETVAELTEREEELAAEVERLDAEADDLEGGEFSEVLDRHREVNQLEFEIGSIEDDLESVREQLADLDDDLGSREELEARREEINAELTDLRTRVDELERDAVEAFNEHMDTVLDVLDYENIERIWLERTETGGRRRGRGSGTASRFDLHIVRSSESGASYEDTVDHLSESEREVTGLVFALAGYLVHEVYDSVPFVLLDSLEALDSDRIAALIEYFSEYVPYVVAALLPEDAAALPEEYHRVTEI